MQSKEHDQTFQDGKRGTERVQTKLGKTHVDYWYSKLFKRTFPGRDGVQVEVPNWQARIKHQGRVMFFNLQTNNRAEAAVSARDIYIFLKANGWEATLEKYKPKKDRPAGSKDPTADELAEVYRKEMELAEQSPIPRTIERYISYLLMICQWLGIKKILKLTPEKVTIFKMRYRKKSLAKGRKEDSVRTTCNTILRSAACLFSNEMLKAYERHGIKLTNPFKDQMLRGAELKPYTPISRELVDQLWRDSALLRDGDPAAAAPPPASKGGRPKKGTRKKRRKQERWKDPDWRKPHPEAYRLLLLELGLGFRREEADKAEWDWFFALKDRRFVEIRKTEFFTPKGKKRRIIPVEEILWDALQESKSDQRFVIAGNQPLVYTRENAPKNIPYRCEEDHRVLVAWLQRKGIKDNKPCHMLRKEFGSYVATSFGLFAAQRLLGHSSPAVTEAFYAGLTELPELRHAQPPKPSGSEQAGGLVVSPDSTDQPAFERAGVGSS